MSYSRVALRFTFRIRTRKYRHPRVENRRVLRAMWGSRKGGGDFRFLPFSSRHETPLHLHQLTRRLVRDRMGKRALRAQDDEYDPLKQRATKRRSTAKEPASDSDSSQATKTSTGQRKGGRTRVACDQCSKRRSRCSLEGPVCDSCQRRDEPCSYESLIWM